MNRRGFVASLLALPAVAKAVAQPPSPWKHFGAARGTWSGGPANLQNLPRPSIGFNPDINVGFYKASEGGLMVSAEFSKVLRNEMRRYVKG